MNGLATCDKKRQTHHHGTRVRALLQRSLSKHVPHLQCADSVRVCLAADHGLTWQAHTHKGTLEGDAVSRCHPTFLCPCLATNACPQMVRWCEGFTMGDPTPIPVCCTDVRGAVRGLLPCSARVLGGGACISVYGVAMRDDTYLRSAAPCVVCLEGFPVICKQVLGVVIMLGLLHWSVLTKRGLRVQPCRALPAAKEGGSLAAGETRHSDIRNQTTQTHTGAPVSCQDMCKNNRFWCPTAQTFRKSHTPPMRRGVFLGTVGALVDHSHRAGSCESEVSEPNRKVSREKDGEKGQNRPD